MPFFDSDLRTQVGEFAFRAPRAACEAASSAMKNQPVTQIRPLIARELTHEVTFHFHRIKMASQSKPAGKPADMRIDDNTIIDAKGISEHHIRRLPPHPGEGSKCIHRLRYLAAVLCHQLACCGLDVFRLGAVKPCRVDDLLKVSERNVHVILSRLAAGKQSLGDEIYPLVRALG